MAMLEGQLARGTTAFGSSRDTLLRNDRALRYERGGVVYASDGRLGTLHQVVVDEHVGEVTALVVHIDALNDLVMLTPLAVRKTGGSAVFLEGTYRQYEEWLLQAPRYQPKIASKANLKALSRSVQKNGVDPRLSITSVGRDYLETGPSQSESSINGQSRQ